MAHAAPRVAGGLVTLHELQQAAYDGLARDPTGSLILRVPASCVLAEDNTRAAVFGGRIVARLVDEPTTDRVNVAVPVFELVALLRRSGLT